MSLKEAALAAFKDAPPVSVGAATLFGVSLNTWVLIATLVYTLLRIYYMVQEHREKRKDGKQQD